MLPYLEQDNLYAHGIVGPDIQYKGQLPGPSTWAGGDGSIYVMRQGVKAFICPSDPGIPDNGQATFAVNSSYGGGWDENPMGLTSYAMNGQVFASVDANGFTLDFTYLSRIPADFPDGMSNTILFAEKYGVCGTNVWNEVESPDYTYAPGTPSYPADGSVAGNMWGWYSANSGLSCFVTTLGGSFSSNHMQRVGPASMFQVAPIFNVNYDPVLAPNGCDFSRASSGHTGVMNTAFGDGSVHALSGGMNPNVWWALCTAHGGEVIDGSAF